MGNRAEEYRGVKVLVMGLGLNGGGVESALYLARKGAEVTVTDLRGAETLAPSLEKLRASGLSFRYVLGEHRMEDFKNADMTVKNPGVPVNSQYLQASRRIETDISIFLSRNPARIIAVTGSKGKSSVSSAFHWVLSQARKGGTLPGKAYLGGNIARSPLAFLDDLKSEDDVVLELSSWQLRDLELARISGGNQNVLKPRTAILTSIMADHQDNYASIEAYVADKKLIYRNQDRGDATVVQDDFWGEIFRRETPGTPIIAGEKALQKGVSGGWIAEKNGKGFGKTYPRGENPSEQGNLSEPREIVPEKLRTPGYHQKKNALSAALGLLDLGLDPDFIRDALGEFPGIEHRLEFFLESRGILCYNDSAATIPEAAAAALEAFEEPLVVVTGGADKNLDFRKLAEAIAAKQDAGRLRSLILLAGTGSDKLIPLLVQGNIPFLGPYTSAGEAAFAAKNSAKPGDIALLSPGCASFGLFNNEFDRGLQWKQAVREAFGATDSEMGAKKV